MRFAIVAVGVAALLAVASARCPNSCSGHGDCGSSDVCTCWPNWTGYDCADRVCEYDIAWATNYRQNAHYYAECSGKGICDRSTGLCACFDGYTGSACRRSVCPNDCSGHGKCRLVYELPEATTAQSSSTTIDWSGQHLDAVEQNGAVFPYTFWDGDKIQACVCDGGFFGPDCSQRYCPHGDDPLTTCKEVSTHTTTQGLQIQQLSLTSTGAAANVLFTNGILKNGATDGSTDMVGDLVLHYTDNEGGVWTTSRIALGTAAVNAQDTAAANIKAALKALPNFRIPDVDVNSGTLVASTGTASTAGVSTTNFLITFTNQRNSGEQQLLSCDPLPLGCNTAGCSPKYTQLRNWNIHQGSADNVGASFTIAIAYTGGSTDVTTKPTNLNLITADSILDNSLQAYDQAKVVVTLKKHGSAGASAWGASASATAPDVYATYKVDWLWDGTTHINYPNTDGTAAYLPSGYTQPSVNAVIDQGVGFNHIPIGYGVYIALPDAIAGLKSSDAADESYTITFTLATARCTVTQTQRADVMNENLECSGRGTCDHSVGVCTCFEGHYGDHCGLQTILV